MTPEPRPEPPVTDDDLLILSQFRRGLRAFLRFTEQVTNELGATPAIYQLVLAVHTSAHERVDIGMAARSLGLEHHSAAELVTRAEDAGFIARERDPGDRRRVLLRVTPPGVAMLTEAAKRNRDELRRIYASTFRILERLGG
jgi:DNA-binding MarR family transcriptional regulator